MPTRAQVASKFVSYDGYHNNAGYDTANKFSAELGRGAEASCADFYSDVFREENLSLPVMQAGEHTGFSFVPDGLAFARDHHATVNSWEALPCDGVCFDWNGDGVADHIEAVVHWHGNVLRTIGMNSGPSNVNGFKGRGGVHMHDWECVKGRGNDLVLAVIDAGKIVNFGGAPKPVPPRPAPSEHPRQLRLKSPNLHGLDIHQLQVALNKLEVHNVKEDGVYGPATRDAVIRAQRRFEDPMGVVDKHTRAFLGLK